jgi:hypothetical protein
MFFWQTNKSKKVIKKWFIGDETCLKLHLAMQAGKSFVRELTRMFQAYADISSLESVALTATMVMPALLLQKPHPKSKAKEHTCI